jgi:alpha-L-fucosidase 2
MLPLFFKRIHFISFRTMKLLLLIFQFILMLFNQSIFGAGETVIACVGNSITSQSGYTEILQRLLGTGYLVYNEGHIGRTMLKNGVVIPPWDGPYWDSEKFDHVFTVNPDIITIMLGTNDSKNENWTVYGSEFYDDYNAMIDTFLTIKPLPRIILCRPPPAFNPSPFNIDSLNLINGIIPIIDSISSERGLSVIDCYTPLTGSPQYFSDKVHPNSEGAGAIARIFFKALSTVSSVNITRPAGNNPAVCGIINIKPDSDPHTPVYNLLGRKIPPVYLRCKSLKIQPLVTRNR